MWLFHIVPWVRLQCVIVLLPDHTHLLLKRNMPSGLKIKIRDPKPTRPSCFIAYKVLAILSCFGFMLVKTIIYLGLLVNFHVFTNSSTHSRHCARVQGQLIYMSFINMF